MNNLRRDLSFNLADLYEAISDVIPDRIALSSGEVRLTYLALDQRANQLAHALKALGVKPRDHVGLYLYNGHQFIESMLALVKLRAVPININYRYVEDEIAYLFDNADMSGVIYQRSFDAIVGKAMAKIENQNLFRVAVAGDSQEQVESSVLSYEALRDVESIKRDFAPRKDTDLYIIYTGGTTGMPRGVVWQHRDLFFAGLRGGNAEGEPFSDPQALIDSFSTGRAPRHIHAVAPLIHGGAQLATWITFLSGGILGLVPGSSFRPEKTLALVEREKIQVISLIGDAMARPLADVLEAAHAAHETYDLSSLVAISSAGAIFSRSVIEKLQKYLPQCFILNHFGASEIGHQGTASYEGEGPAKWAMDENTAVFDENHQPLEPGSEKMGMLARSGPLPLGYYKDPKKTAETFIDYGGKRWVLPGDLARIEADRRIILFGRSKFCINTGGEKVFPEEVEEVLKAATHVFDALVLAVPHTRWGEAVAAVLQPDQDQTLDLKAVETHCRAHLAGYKIPRLIKIVAHVERHPSGKPDYSWARTQFKEAK